MRIEHQIKIKVSEDEDQLQLLLTRAADAVTKVIRDDCDEAVITRDTIPASSTDYAIPFGVLTTAAIVYVETDVAITVKLNGSIALAITPATGEVGRMFWEGAFTAMSITTTVEANVTVALMG